MKKILDALLQDYRDAKELGEVEDIRMAACRIADYSIDSIPNAVEIAELLIERKQ